jgi:two-component system response regulator NreC
VHLMQMNLTRAKTASEGKTVPPRSRIAIHSRRVGDDSGSIAVVVISETGIHRTALASLLATLPDIRIVGEQETVDDSAFTGNGPHVAVIAAKAGDLCWITGIRALAAQRIAIPVVVVLPNDDVSEVQCAFAAGATGVVYSKADVEELHAAVRAAAVGDRYLDPHSALQLLSASAPAGTPRHGEILTTREAEVLKLVAMGYTNRGVAETLHISVRTVEAHRLRAMHKCSLRDRSGLVRFAIAQGLISAPKGRD